MPTTPAASPRVVIDDAVPQTLSDGTVLMSTVFRPEDAEKHPVLLTRTPYGRLRASAPGLLDPVDAAQKGFVVVLQDVRGRGASEGAFEPSVHEREDGAEAVEWAAGLPGSDGRVCLWGRSYFAETQLWAASAAPAGLRAIAPRVPAGLNPQDGWLFRGGAFELGSRSPGASTPSRRTRRTRNGRRWTARSPAATGPTPRRCRHPRTTSIPSSGRFSKSRWRAGWTWTARWSGPASTRGRPRRRAWSSGAGSTCSCAMPWTSGTPSPRPRPAPPWSSGPGPTPTSPARSPGSTSPAEAASGSLQDLQLRWFRHQLGDQDLGTPRVLLYAMGRNRWLSFQKLSPVDERWTAALGGSDRLVLSRGDSPTAPDAPGSRELPADPRDPVPTLGGATMMAGTFLPKPHEQSALEGRDDVLVYTSDPLEQELALYGPVTAHVEIEMGAPDTDVVVTLSKVSPDGASTLVTDGITRVSHRDSLSPDGRFEQNRGTRLCSPGGVVGVDVMLWPTFWSLAPGERLRVRICCSNYPRWDRNPQTGERQFSETRPPAPAVHRILGTAEHPSSISFGTLQLP